MPLLTIRDLLNNPADETAACMTKAIKLSSTFDKYILKSSRGEETRASGIHASEVSGCERRIVYSLMGYSRSGKAVDTTWRRRFMMGVAVHELLQSEFHKMALDSEYTITFQDEICISPDRQKIAAAWNIHSSCDGRFIIRDKWTGEAKVNVLLEIKTMNPTEFQNLKQPKEEHMDQAHVYMACLDAPLIWLLYWNKGNQNITGTDNPNFLVRYDPRRWERLEDKFARVHQAADEQKLPDRQESIVCNFCAFAAHCQPAILNRHATKPPIGRYL